MSPLELSANRGEFAWSGQKNVCIWHEIKENVHFIFLDTFVEVKLTHNIRNIFKVYDLITI